VFRSEIYNYIGTGKNLFQGIRLTDIGIKAESGVFPAAVFIGDGNDMPGGKETCCKAGADKTGAADYGDVHYFF
jgi:hypothetical protein